MKCKKCGNEEKTVIPLCRNCCKEIFRSSKIPWYLILGIPLLLIFFFSLNSQPTINLNDYIRVEFTGYDTVGHAKVYFDETLFDSKYGKKLKYKQTNTSSDYIAFEFCQYINPYIEKTDFLTNGEEIGVGLEFDRTVLEERYNCKIKYSDETISVSGLQGFETFDPFENIKISYSGASPKAEAVIEILSDDEIYNDLDINVYSDYVIANGNKGVIACSVKGNMEFVEYFASTYGKVPSPAQKTIVFENIPSYVQSVNDIDATYLEELIADAKQKSIESITDSAVTITKQKYLGCYAFYYTNSTYPYGDNRVVLCFEQTAHITVPDTNFNDDLTYYQMHVYDNVIKNVDGTYSSEYKVSASQEKQINYKAKYGARVLDYKYYTIYGNREYENMVKACERFSKNSYMQTCATYDSTFGRTNKGE